MRFEAPSASVGASTGLREQWVEPTSPEPVPLLMAIPDDVRVRLLDLGISRRYQPGEVIVLQATATAGLCVVESGLVKISTTSADGREQVLRFVGTNASFNEVAALDGGPNPATATALEPSVVLRVPRDEFVTVMAETPGLPEMIVQALAGRLRHLIELVEDLSFRHVSERVARILLQSVTPHAGVGAGADLSRHVTQRELAEMAGTSREVVARALKALEAAGAISINRGEITLVAPSKLGAAR